jgi:hypothetical protein
MKNRDRIAATAVGLAALAAAGLFWGCAGPSPLPRRSQSAGVRADGPDWSNRSLDLMIEKYGRPDRVDTTRVVWEKKGPWTRIVVWDDMGARQLDMSADNNLEEIVAYLVPEEKRRAVEGFSRRLKVSADGAQLSSRSVSEGRNFLGLNLADEIIRGVKTPDEAKVFEAATLQLADAGKSSPYMTGLLFQAPPLPSTTRMMTSDEVLAPPESR